MRDLLWKIYNADREEADRLRKAGRNTINHKGTENAFLESVFGEPLRCNAFADELLKNGLCHASAKGIDTQMKDYFLDLADREQPLFRDFLSFTQTNSSDSNSEYFKMLGKVVIRHFRDRLPEDGGLLFHALAEYIINQFRYFNAKTLSVAARCELLTEAVTFDISDDLPKKATLEISNIRQEKYQKDLEEFSYLMNTTGLHSRSGLLACLALAEKGNIYAMQSAGTIEFFGLLGQRNFQKAFDWHYRQVADCASGQAAWSIADMMYRYDEYSDRLKDFVIYYPAELSNGSRRRFEKPADPKELQNWYEEMVDFVLLGYRRGSKAAANMISQIIEDGSVPTMLRNRLKDIKSAEEWALDGAEGGNPHAMLRTSVYLSKRAQDAATPEEEEKYEKLSRRWLKKSAEMYLPAAMRNYALLLHKEGKDAEAKEYLKKLIEDRIGATGNYFGGILTAIDLYPDLYSKEEKIQYLKEARNGAEKQYLKNRPQGNIDFCEKCDRMIRELEGKDEI